ncbi:amidohydrolase family protein [Rhodococcus sp. NPDC059969]|uniref:metal-dependent hydrolase family protein n=1 Tax=Rhodococcus sp. NPDC059969 TaxID=3347018 RepID=UPI00366BEA34
MSVVWLTGATIIDGTGADPIENCAVAVENGRISALGGTPPEGAEVLDCTGLTITPGLIDAHVHLGGSSDLAPSLRRQISVAELAADMFATCASTLDGGFTTVRDCGGIDGGLAGVVASGKIPGPRIIQCGPIQCQTGGHGHLAAEWEPTSDWSDHDIPGLRCMSLLSDGPHEMRKNVRETFRRGADFLKLCVTGGVVSTHDKLTDTQFTVDEIEVAVEEANARGTYVTVHAHNNEGIRNAVTAGAKCVEHGSDIDDETAKLMAEQDVALVPTLAVVQALSDSAASAGLPESISARIGKMMQGQIDGLLAARNAGVRVGLGSDLIGTDQTGRGMELVLRAKVETPMDALVSATRINADILGIADEVGTIEVGKFADLVAFRGNPLTDPSIFADRERIALVIQSGRVVKDCR